MTEEQIAEQLKTLARQKFIAEQTALEHTAIANKCQGAMEVFAKMEPVAEKTEEDDVESDQEG